ncbi:MAG: prolyl oligopeptidase family serine peptidase [Spirochaetales bacterium]|nr:prolyl oligopeptidase family serine peptidase [Spirochaetales bacterium]
MTRKTICLMAAVMAIMLCLCSCSTTKQNLEDIVTISSGHFACTYDGVKHDFIVDTPENPVGSSLVIMLPGAGGTAESFRQSTLFHEKACPNGYTVVYVTGAPDPKDSSSATSWNHNGRKDSNDDVGFLKTLASFIQDKYHTDPNRCFAAGFSNGAFMCHRLAMEASDTFSAVISVAGTISDNTWNSRPKDCKASLLQIAGEKDDVIPKHSDNSARYSAFPAIEEVIDYYANGLESTDVRKIGKDSTLTEYGDFSRHVWFLYVKDGRHSWSAESVTGIDTNALIIDFLSQMK